MIDLIWFELNWFELESSDIVLNISELIDCWFDMIMLQISIENTPAVSRLWGVFMLCGVVCYGVVSFLSRGAEKVLAMKHNKFFDFSY